MDSGHLCLLGIRERTEGLGGTLHIETREGAGTKIAITLPLERPLPKDDRDATEGAAVLGRSHGEDGALGALGLGKSFDTGGDAGQGN